MLKIGQSLKGKSGTYTLTGNVFRGVVWTALDQKQNTVIVKTGPKPRLDRGREVLERYHHAPHLRHMLDDIERPPALILEHLTANLLAASNARSLEHADVKFIARNVLETVRVLHKDGIAHTDVKPDNILIDYGHDAEFRSRFSKAVLGDLGDAFQVDLNADPKDMAKEDGHIIGSAIFRSPEAMLNLKWGTATDIWSFGATLISLIWGKNWHMFQPDEVTIDDENYPAYVLIKQADHFGPFPLSKETMEFFHIHEYDCPVLSSYQEIADDERLATLTLVNNYSSDNGTRKPFKFAQDPELSDVDREFICKIMKLDPRDRPTAEQLLQDKWFRT